MTQITFIDAAGGARTVEAENGASLMEAAVRNGIPGIEAECGGACACATCHLYIEPEWVEKVGPPQAMEKDMLDFAWEAEPSSRLSCQIRVRPELTGLTVRTPAQQGWDSRHSTAGSIASDFTSPLWRASGAGVAPVYDRGDVPIPADHSHPNPAPQRRGE